MPRFFQGACAPTVSSIGILAGFRGIRSINAFAGLPNHRSESGMVPEDVGEADTRVRGSDQFTDRCLAEIGSPPFPLSPKVTDTSSLLPCAELIGNAEPQHRREVVGVLSSGGGGSQCDRVNFRRDRVQIVEQHSALVKADEVKRGLGYTMRSFRFHEYLRQCANHYLFNPVQ